MSVKIRQGFVLASYPWQHHSYDTNLKQPNNGVFMLPIGKEKIYNHYKNVMAPF
jgi:hypothetical protein